MKAPTKEIITPKTKTKVTIKEWITGGESEELQNTILEGMDIGADGKPTSISGTMVVKQNHKAIELAVVDIGGSTGDVLKALLDLPRDDYEFVLKSVNEITSPKVMAQSGTDIKSS